MDSQELQELSVNNQSAIVPIAPEGFKSGFVAIVGRPNVGKSTLMNHLIGQKIAITSPVAQTTRNRLQGILTTSEAQIIFVDTPGIHKPHHELGKLLVQNAKTAIKSVDLVLFVVDSSTDAGTGDHFIFNILKHLSVPVILGLNKVDLQPKNYQFIDDSYADLIADTDWSTVKFSATTGVGTEQLQQALIENLESGPYYYPPDLVTDQPERFIIAELIREQILLHTRQEIPHSVAITIEKMEETPKITKINAAINIERSSQKGIIIGKKGSMLKTIGTAARKQIQKLISGGVYLELFVKVEPQWRQSRIRLAEFGYQVEE
ncbi:GTPase Era [Pleurocapsa sp. PCC 7319]|uniref:GTPase Era n=1 Tax=Pleurocapsa sp. PCC 7319 TaxID=118161 RepID=UPI00034DDA4D|nr:GTPase Era [Pleurocapsa sp. PCC 7319]